MKIPVILNEEKVILDADCDERLLYVLRRRNLISAKAGCEQGRCGSCAILLDEKPVSSCLIPAGIARNSKIETLEHFSKSEVYTDIIKGFESAGARLCGYCEAVKVFSVYDLLNRPDRPTVENINNLASEMTCPCTEKNSFVSGVLHAVANYRERTGIKKNG